MIENFDEQIEKLVEDNCKHLGINMPKMMYFTSKNREAIATTAYDETLKNYTMLVDRNVDDIRDAFFYVFHELRHIWQRIKRPDIYFLNYASLPEVGSRNYYNQIEEIDANAYSLAMMKICFNLVPKVSTLPKEAQDLVNVRAKKIVKEWHDGH